MECDNGTMHHVRGESPDGEFCQGLPLRSQYLHFRDAHHKKFQKDMEAVEMVESIRQELNSGTLNAKHSLNEPQVPPERLETFRRMIDTWIEAVTSETQPEHLSANSIAVDSHSGVVPRGQVLVSAAYSEELSRIRQRLRALEAQINSRDGGSADAGKGKHTYMCSVIFGIMGLAISLSLALALMWGAAHNDLSGGFTRGGCVLAGVVAPFTSIASHLINTTATTYLSYGETTSWSPVVSFSTLCDGHPRAPSGAFPSVYSTSVIRTTDVPFTTRVVDPNYSIPYPTTPPCNVPDDSQPCTTLQKIYQSMSDMFWNKGNAKDIPFGLWYPPGCQASIAPVPTSSPPLCPAPSSGRYCNLMADRITQLYWPQTTVSGDLCKQDGAIVTLAPTDPPLSNTAVYDGETITSPSVLMILGAISSNGCGSRLTDVTLTMKQDEVSKIYWSNRGRRTTSMTWDNLNTMPFGVYNSEQICEVMEATYRVRGCSTIFGDYSPYLAIPTSVTSMLPEWEGCTLDNYARAVNWVPLADVPDANGELSGSKTEPAKVEAKATGL
ncbi:hypothetical protein BDV96DRAFT_683806 [Lophiotrema nucula]|uniref:Uncharacterized protein n=1 Tax=Lophiotrema nucula TaxID=690887 RepID=A0A6A5ZNB0_9PLEO|nr:hypothetical protein BDV96DRAFT_683806 [Lophiotrema nucula]